MFFLAEKIKEGETFLSMEDLMREVWAALVMGLVLMGYHMLQAETHYNTVHVGHVACRVGFVVAAMLFAALVGRTVLNNSPKEANPKS